MPPPRRPVARRFPAHGTTTSLRLWLLLASVGGFLDAYCFVERGGVFACAQTGNVVLFGVQAGDGDWTAAPRHLPPIAAFAVGIACVEYLRQAPDHPLLRRPARAVLGLEVVVLLAVGLLPASFPDGVAVAALSFVTALQGAMFAKVGDVPSNSTLITAALGTTASSVYSALLRRDPEAAARAARFGALVAAFAAGALLGSVLSGAWDERAAWAAAAVLLAAIALFAAARRRG